MSIEIISTICYNIYANKNLGGNFMNEKIIEIMQGIKDRQSTVSETKKYIENKIKNHENDIRDKKETIHRLNTETDELRKTEFSVNLDTLVEVVAQKHGLKLEDVNPVISFNYTLFNPLLAECTRDELFTQIDKQLSYKSPRMALVLEDKTNNYNKIAQFDNPINLTSIQQDGRPLKDHITFRTTIFADFGKLSELVCRDYRPLRFTYKAHELANTDHIGRHIYNGLTPEDAQNIIDAIALDNSKKM